MDLIDGSGYISIDFTDVIFSNSSRSAVVVIRSSVQSRSCYGVDVVQPVPCLGIQVVRRGSCRGLQVVQPRSRTETQVLIPRSC